MSSADDGGQEHECPTCERSFGTRQGLGQHHAAAHEEKLRAEVDCAWCGTKIERYPYQIKQSNNHFCSDSDCRSNWQSEQTGETSPNWQGGKVEVVCSYCGTSLTRWQAEVVPGKRFFCGDKGCRAAWLSENMCGEDNPSWAGGMVTIECEICGEPFDVIPSRADIARCCSEDCSGRWFSKNHRAQNSPLYRGGESIYHAVKHSLPGPSWITVSKDARDRAGRECEWCGRSKAEVGVSLHAHHIIPILSGGTNRDGNVIVLCPQCHVRAESFTRERIGPVLTDWTDDELPDGRLSSRKYMIQAADMVTSEQATFAAFADD